VVLCGTWSETSVAPSQLTQFWQIPRQNAFLFTVHAIFRHDYPLAVEPASTPRPLVQKKTLRYSLPIDILLSVVSVLVVAQSSSEFSEGLMNNPVYFLFLKYNQQDATLYNILYYCQCSTRFRRFLRPSSGAQKLYAQHRVYVKLA